jgi:hypothetical protein
VETQIADDESRKTYLLDTFCRVNPDLIISIARLRLMLCGLPILSISAVSDNLDVERFRRYSATIAASRSPLVRGRPLRLRKFPGPKFLESRIPNVETQNKARPQETLVLTTS